MSSWKDSKLSTPGERHFQANDEQQAAHVTLGRGDMKDSAKRAGVFCSQLVNGKCVPQRRPFHSGGVEKEPYPLTVRIIDRSRHCNPDTRETMEMSKFDSGSEVLESQCFPHTAKFSRPKANKKIADTKICHEGKAAAPTKGGVQLFTCTPKCAIQLKQLSTINHLHKTRQLHKIQLLQWHTFYNHTTHTARHLKHPVREKRTRKLRAMHQRPRTLPIRQCATTNMRA